MINVPSIAANAKLTELELRELAVLRALQRPITSDDIKGYQIVAKELWTVQHFKCCYCEHKVPKSYNDVEHYRPKARADRRPGCLSTYGYWWLAFNRNNLLFACPSCNRSSKNDLFPLDAGSISLAPEQPPPASELPLLIHPAGLLNPVDHIKFVPLPPFSDTSVNADIEAEANSVRWIAVPRGRSRHGRFTIDVTDLNRMELRELRSDYFREYIWPVAHDLRMALVGGVQENIEHCMRSARRLVSRRAQYTALSYDALKHLVPQSSLATYALAWPAQGDVGKT